MAANKKKKGGYESTRGQERGIRGLRENINILLLPTFILSP
jgi:hypothetical protein